MKNFDPQVSKIVNFIFEKPEVVVRILQKYGYKINVKTTTFQEIDGLTFGAIERNEIGFINDLFKAMNNTTAESITSNVVSDVKKVNDGKPFVLRVNGQSN